VKDIALAIGTTMGLPSARLQMLRRAALLHDIGKLSVPNSILDKPGNLTETEFQVIASHSRLSREILGRISAFDEIAVIAGNHHEKLDGSGYPNHLLGEQLPFESRLIAVADVYGALSEDRPYRKTLDSTEIQSIMTRLVPGKLDSTCFDALEAALDEASLCQSSTPHAPPPQTLSITTPAILCSLPC